MTCKSNNKPLFGIFFLRKEIIIIYFKNQVIKKFAVIYIIIRSNVQNEKPSRKNIKFDILNNTIRQDVYEIIRL